MHGESSFAAVLKAARRAARLTQEQLAERSGIAVNTISALERGIADAPRARTAELLAGGLGLAGAERAGFLARAGGLDPEPAVVFRRVLVPPTALIGREEALAELGQMLAGPSVRLVTLTGPGGVGKTRLAAAAAAGAPPAAVGEIVDVDLAGARDGAGLLREIAAALGEEDKAEGTEGVAGLIGRRRLLLMLDSFEQLVTAAPLLSRVLARCALLKILVTSRVPLRIRGEHEMPVAPLAVPGALASPAEIAASAAIRVFAARARERRAGWRLDAATLGPAAAICRAVDGIPLAVELAACHIGTLDAAQIAERLGESMGPARLLTSGPQDMPVRQRILAAAIDWSYGLLSSRARVLLRRLAVFPAVFSAEAAEQVCGGTSGLPVAAVLGSLASLVDTGLIRSVTVPAGARYRLHQTVREYARERLDESGERKAMAEALSEYVLRLTEDAFDGLSGAGRPGGRAGRGPRHLLPDTALFTGRDREMDALLALAGQAGSADSPGAVVISAIDGMGGVGKTALALHAAHRLADRYPDGHLFINLAGFTAGTQPLDPAQALAELLRDLGIPPRLIPDGLEARAGFYRDRLHGTRTLIVLDNAASEDQVRPLLPGTGSCLVLITSRKRLTALDDALLLPLDVLAPAEAVTLLRRAARLPAASTDGGDGDGEGGSRLLEQVAGLCGRLPLALLIAAALLRAHGRAWTLDHLIARLAARPPGRELAPFDDGTRNLTALFDVSYHALPDGLQQFYRRLGVLPGPEIDGYAAAALLAGDPEQAGELLEQLAGCSLLEAASPGRYRMHDLLRAHARTLAAADPGSGEAARARLYHYYQHTARRAATLTASTPRPGPSGPAPACAPPLPDAETAWAWLRAERANLQAAIDHAGRHNLGPDLITLTAGPATVLQADSPGPQAATLHQAAAATAGRLGDHRSQAGALTDLGNARLGTGDYPGATDALTQALQAYRDLGNRLGQAAALTGLGHVRLLTGDHLGATDALTQALQAYRDLGNRHGQAAALTRLGHVRLQTSDYPGATDALTQALQAYRDLGNRLGQAAALTGLGDARLLTGDYPGATDALTQALQAYRDLGNRHGQAAALTRLGDVRRLTGDYPGATDALTQALQAYRDLGDRHGQAAAFTRLGDARRLTGDYPGATDALTQALQTFRDFESRGDEAWALNYYAAAVRGGGDVPRALELYQQALAMNRELGKPDDEAIALEGTGECLLAQGRTAEGTARLRQALDLYQRLGMRADTERLTTHLAAPTRTPPPETG